MNKALTFDDVLLVPKYCGFESRKEVDISTIVANTNCWMGEFSIPICSANMDTITGVQMATTMGELGGIGVLHRFCSIEENIQMLQSVAMRERVVVSIGVNEGLKRAEQLCNNNARMFCLDIAHAHSKLANETIRSLRAEFPHILIIAGNVSTLEGASYLVDCGADVIKVGQGSGGCCSTRIKTGFGVPQLTAIFDCVKCGAPIISDGGCRTPGDIAKALAAGASMVMLGSMLAGTDECPGEVIGGYKTVRGMASKEAYEDFFEGPLPDWKTAEGISTRVKYKGPVKNVIDDIVGGLRSAFTYCGAANLKEFQRKAEFIEITHAGYQESVPHILLNQ